MRVLAIETSAPTGSIALWASGECLQEQAFEGVRNHAAQLAPRVRALLAAHGGLKTIDGYAISIGPGSFTGLRIGVSFVKGLAAAHRRPAVGISTLRIMAIQALRDRQTDRCLAVLDARRGELFGGLYDRLGGQDARWPDGLYRLEAVPKRLKAVGLGSVAIGGHAVGDRWQAVGDRLFADADWAREDLATPWARTVAEVGAAALEAGEGVDASLLDPAYHQRSAAEVNLGIRAPDDTVLRLGDGQDEESGCG